MRQARLRQRRAAMGLTQVTVWVPADQAKLVRDFAATLLAKHVPQFQDPDAQDLFQ